MKKSQSTLAAFGIAVLLVGCGGGNDPISDPTAGAQGASMSTVEATGNASAPVAVSNLLLNGSFETPVLAPGSNLSVLGVGSTAIPGWSVVGPAGTTVAVIQGTYNLPDVAGINCAASDGAQWIDITGYGSNAAEGLEQTVNLKNGTYTISFDIGNIVAPELGFGTTTTVDLLINGVRVQSFTNSASTAGAINWQRFFYTFKARGLTTITLLNADPVGDNQNALDNVVLLPVKGKN